MNNVGILVGRYRKASGLNQRELAEKIGVNHSTICQWERGRNEPRASRLTQIAEVLGVSVQDLTGRSPMRIVAGDGRWIFVDSVGGEHSGIYKCINCGKHYWMNNNNLYNYCPNCGIVMVKGDENDEVRG